LNTNATNGQITQINKAKNKLVFIRAIRILV